MIYLQPTITITGMDARELALLLRRQAHFEAQSLADLDDLMCDLRKGLVRVVQDIKYSREFDAEFKRTWQLSSGEDRTYLHATADRFRGCMNAIRRYRDTLIGLVELCWALEEQRGWGMDESYAVAMSEKRDRERDPFADL